MRQLEDTRVKRALLGSDVPGGDNSVLNFFLDYWQRRRGSRAMPARADIRPSDIKTHIGSIVIAEALPGFEDFRFKLIGTEVSRYFLANSTGKTIREIYAGANEKFGECVLENYRETARTQQPLFTSISDIRWTNNLRYNMESIYLPLSEDGSAASSVLTAFTYRFCGKAEKISSH
jgi:hypothetical protein